MKYRTRLKITVLSMIFLLVVTAIAIKCTMENLAITAVGSWMTILTAYVWGETKRPSDGSN